MNNNTDKMVCVFTKKAEQFFISIKPH